MFSQVWAQIFFIAIIFVMGCNSENAPDCFQSAGDLARVEVAVPDFQSITVFERLNLVLRQGEEQKVEIESGEFLLNDISAEVQEDRLILRNENSCNLFRDFAISTVYVTSPNLMEIRSSTGLLISTDGPLNYSILRLVSEDFVEPEAGTTSGSFDMELNVDDLSIVANGIAFFKLRGTANDFRFNVPAGDVRIEADSLVAQSINLNHRGTNDAIVNPQQSISGVVRGLGNIISINRPPEIDVEETFDGRLIFRD